jgi:hypothetical protein
MPLFFSTPKPNELTKKATTIEPFSSINLRHFFLEVFQRFQKKCFSRFYFSTSSIFVREKKGSTEMDCLFYCLNQLLNVTSAREWLNRF